MSAKEETAVIRYIKKLMTISCNRVSELYSFAPLCKARVFFFRQKSAKKAKSWKKLAATADSVDSLAVITSIHVDPGAISVAKFSDGLHFAEPSGSKVSSIDFSTRNCHY